jgi:ribonuclease P protein component
VLPERNRLHRSQDFSRVMRGGRRVGRHDIVVHAYRDAPIHAADDFRAVFSGADPARFGGPRFGLIVSKAVGSSVERHRVARLLRSAARSVVAESDPEAMVVIRALPSASAATTSELSAQLRSALARLNLVRSVGGAG